MDSNDIRLRTDERTGTVNVSVSANTNPGPYTLTLKTIKQRTGDADHELSTDTVSILVTANEKYISYI